MLSSQKVSLEITSRCSLVRPELKSLALAVVDGELHEDTRLVEQGAIRSLQDWDESTVGFEVPLGLSFKIGLAFLEWNFLGRH